jgi:hypothetical protein
MYKIEKDIERAFILMCCVLFFVPLSASTLKPNDGRHYEIIANKYRF